jgi:hypothetical protein
MRLADLTAAGRLPFGNEPDTLVESYSAVAELSCCLTVGVRMPANVLCTYTEACAYVNGQEIEGLEDKRPSLLEMCELFGIERMDKARKDAMRDLILSKPISEYTPENWAGIEDYNAIDVREDVDIFNALAGGIDLERALTRGQYSKVVASMEHVGLPIDAPGLETLNHAWDDLRRHYIDKLDTLRLYDEDYAWSDVRMAALIEAREWWEWPRTPSGKFALDRKTFGKQVQRHPELKSTQRLRDQIAELRLGKFLNTVGADGFSRCPIMPWWTRTGRNQPQGRDLAFLLGLPAWIHGLLKPPPGYGLACIDWIAQEVGIGAGLSGCPNMTADFLTGDSHTGLAIRLGLAPAGATKHSHREIRESVKRVNLGTPYGISKHGIARITGKSLRWAREVHMALHHHYRRYFEWQDGVVLQALMDGKIVSPLGWPMAVHAGTRRRALMNYLHQAGGADMMRLVAVAATEAGILIVAPVHDAFWILAPLDELEDAITTMSRIMIRASAVVTGGLEIPVEVSAVVPYPKCLGDVRKYDPATGQGDKGQALWLEIQGLVRDIAKRRTG